MAEIVQVDHNPFAGSTMTAATGPSGVPRVEAKREGNVAPVDHNPFAGDDEEGHGGLNQFSRAQSGALMEHVGKPIDYLLSTAAAPFTGRAPFVRTGEPEGTPGEPRFKPVEKGIDYVLGHSTIPPPNPENYGERVQSAAGNMLGENLPFIGGVGTLANSGARLGVRALGEGGDIVKRGINSILDAISRKPIAAPIAEGLASAESGAGGEIARTTAEQNDVGPQGQKLAQGLGELLTPAAADYVTPVGLAMKFGQPLVNAGARGVNRAAGTIGEAIPEAYRPAWMNSPVATEVTARQGAAQEGVNQTLGDILRDPDVARNVNESAAVQKEIPGFNPGIARSSNDRELLNTQTQFDKTATGPELRQRQKEFEASAGAIRDKLDTTVPRAGENPADLVGKAVESRVGGAQKAVGNEIEANRGLIEEQSNRLPEVNRAQIGDSMRTARAREKANADQEVERLKGEIGDPNTPIKVGDETVTLRQVMDRQTAINQELRAYNSATMRNVDDIRQMRALETEKANLDRAINETDPEMVPGLKAYRGYYRDQYVPRFSEGASRDVGRYNQFGYDKSRVSDEAVPGKFFAPNNISGARQFNRLYGENAEVRRQMSDYALDDLRQKAIGPDGLIKKGAVEKWLTQHERVLSEMPWVRDAVRATNPDELYARIGRLTQRQRQVADTKVAGLLGKNPDQMIDAGIRDWQTMRGLARSVQGDEKAEAALQRAVWDRVVKAAGPDTLVDPTKLRAFIDQNRRSLQQVLTPEHLSNIETVAKAAEIQGRAGRRGPEGTVETPMSTPQKVGEATGITIPSAVGSLLGVARGRSSKFVEGALQGVKFWSRQKARATEEAWKEALSNPDMAKVMADSFKSRSGPTNAQLHKMYTYLLVSGAHDVSNAAE